MAKYYIFDTYTRISLKSSTPEFEDNALSIRRNAYGIAHQILLSIAVSIKKAHASVHTCAHWPESSLLVHIKNGSR